MFSGGLRELIFQVVKSWQVIAVTVTLVLYMFLIGYVTRSYGRPRSVSKSRPKKTKSPKKTKPGPKAAPEDENSNEALGLTEA